MRIEDITYDADELTMVGHLAVGGSGSEPRPGVLLCHEGPGLDDHVKGRAERIAEELGYVAFALDYHGGGKPLPLTSFMERLGVLMADPDRTRAIARAGLDVLLAQPETDGSRVAVIGYCFGGAMALELARTGADLQAVVGFHPGFGTAKTEDSRNITGAVLMCVGSEDPIVPAAARQAFEDDTREAGVADWRLHVLGGAQHTFTNPAADAAGIPGVAYHRKADERSWQSMLDLFAETLA